MEDIIVTMTSWPGRMMYDISPTIESIMTNSVLPTKMYLNLSSTEWKDTPLPEYINTLTAKYNNFIVNWVDGPNTKTFKKLLPILEMYPNNVIITVDDDVIYPNNFIEELLKAYRKDPTRPVTTSYFNKDGMLFVWGGATLYHSSFLKGYKDLLSDEVISTYEDDWFYTYVLLRNQIKPQLPDPCICYDPWKYPQTIYENSMFANKTYNSDRTKAILDNQLIKLGTSFKELTDSLWEKYNHTLV